MAQKKRQRDTRSIERELDSARKAIAADVDALDVRLRELSPRAIAARHSLSIVITLAAAGIVIALNGRKSAGPLAAAAVSGVAVWLALDYLQRDR